jgi:hypothetical protein
MQKRLQLGTFINVQRKFEDCLERAQAILAKKAILFRLS